MNLVEELNDLLHPSIHAVLHKNSRSLIAVLLETKKLLVERHLIVEIDLLGKGFCIVEQLLSRIFLD